MNFTVIIPCYNSEKTIVKCVQSVFNQTLLPKEVIVIDDGSKDQTLNLLHKIREHAPKGIEVVILTQENSGPSVARNNGINHSTCDWIAFLDSDDYWEFNNLKIAKIFLDKNSFNLIGGSKLEIDYKEISFKDLMYKNYFQTSTTFVKKEWIKKYPFNEKQKYSEDYRSWLLISSETKACVVGGYISNPVISRNFAFTGGGLSSKLWEMEKGEINNYVNLFKLKKINVFMLIKVCSYSFLKFIRRLIMR
ncbi:MULTISPECIES: glycosyltransferase family A protein [unclassified Empedobacter]|uniref:glycosyltransferase family 2 protein n=1 Tax=unclassified Empedobacter TaxID=2643773 RepID=UPI0025BCFD5F|nr:MULTISPECIES: glycosyltransferase family A protein [unclassified Empedobacter]